MLQGQKFQFGNYKLKNLMDAQVKYRMDSAHRTGRPLETITTPFDDQISTLEEDLNDTEAEYKLSQENPITQSYKNKVKSLAGMSKPEENLDDDISDIPDLEQTLDQEINPQPQETQQLVGNDIAPDDTVTKIFPYGRAAIEATQPGHSVLAQADARLMKKQMAGDQVPGAIEQEKQAPTLDEGIPPDIAPMGDTNILQNVDKKLFEDIYPRMGAKDVSTDYMSEPEEMPYVPPPVDQEADVMLKNMDLLKTPPLGFKLEDYKAPAKEKYAFEPERDIDTLGIKARQIIDWGNVLGGKGFTNENEKFFNSELDRLNKYKIRQTANLEKMSEKNRQSDKDAFEKFQYDQNTKFKMANLNQEAQEKTNRLKFDMLKLQANKNKGNNEYKEAYKLAGRFSKLHHVSNYPERVDAFRNAMSAPPTGSGDKDIIENLVKFIDPKGVIREGKVKFMTSALKKFSMNPDGSLNIDKFNRYMHTGLKGGFLTPEDRRELLEATIPMMQNFTRTYDLALKQHQAIFTNRGWDANLLTPFEKAVATQEQYEAARNKINADYMKAKSEIQGQLKTRSENPNVLENQLKDYIPDFLSKYIPGGKEPEAEKGTYLDELEKKYGK